MPAAAVAALACLGPGIVPAQEAAPAKAAPKSSRFLHEPDVGPRSIVFVAGEDLFTVPLAGGRATRLTAHPGAKAHPRFSPDGATIAYTGTDGGNLDVYLVSARGGAPRRLTWHPSADRVQGFSPDGTRVLFASDRESDHFRPRLMTVEVGGGHPAAFPMHKAFRGAYSPDGRRLAYTPHRDAFLTWKRYRGGETPRLWLLNLADYSHVEVPRRDSNDTWPVWTRDGLFFLSDRTGVMSLHRYDPASAQVSEVRREGTTDIDSLAGGHGRLVYTSGGYVFLYDVASRTARRLSVQVPGEGPVVPRTVNVAEQVASRALSPSGSEVALEARGDILVVPAAGGPARNLTRSSGAADRQPAWSPDRRLIAYFSDEGGEYGLYAADPAGSAAPRRLGLEPTGLGSRIRFSPDGKTLAYVDRFGRLHTVGLGDGRNQEIESRLAPGDVYAWAPDSRALVYSRLRPTQIRDLTHVDVASGASRTLTDGIGDAQSPAISRDGSTVYFLGSVDSGKTKTGLDLSVIAHQNDVHWSVYAFSLTAGAPADGSDASAGARSMRRLPLPAGRYTDLDLASDGALLLAEEPDGGTFAGKPRIRRVDPATGSATDFLTGVEGDWQTSADGGHVLYRSDGSWRVAATSAPPASSSGAVPSAALDTSKLEIAVDPPAEWRQMFHEAWRNMRDHFYDDKLHGVDWPAMRARYEAWLPDLRQRSDLDFVFQHLVGELVNSHISVAGESRPKTEPVKIGLLGADYEVANGRYRIKRIVAGSPWDEERSPLLAPGVAVGPGDYLLEVEGQDVRPPRSVFSFFQGKAGQPVTLAVGADPDPARARRVTVVPLESEAALRRRDWIERNRRRVHELSGGRIAYVYQPDTGDDSLREFDRTFFPQSDKEAVLIDERFNDGGGDPDYQLDILDRQLLHWYQSRNAPPFRSPYSLVTGPKVMLVNAEAGSGGDVYPYQFTLRRLGTTVGTRTWGGVQGGGGGPRLIDGGSVRAPNLGTWAPDGRYILENSGFSPDIVVEVYPADDFAGRDPQLERAVAILVEALQKNPPRGVPELERVDRSLGAHARER